NRDSVHCLCKIALKIKHHRAALCGVLLDTCFCNDPVDLRITRLVALSVHIESKEANPAPGPVLIGEAGSCITAGWGACTGPVGPTFVLAMTIPIQRYILLQVVDAICLDGDSEVRNHAIEHGSVLWRGAQLRPGDVV